MPRERRVSLVDALFKTRDTDCKISNYFKCAENDERLSFFSENMRSPAFHNVYGLEYVEQEINIFDDVPLPSYNEYRNSVFCGESMAVLQQKDLLLGMKPAISKSQYACENQYSIKKTDFDEYADSMERSLISMVVVNTDIDSGFVSPFEPRPIHPFVEEQHLNSKLRCMEAIEHSYASTSTSFIQNSDELNQRRKTNNDIGYVETEDQVDLDRYLSQMPSIMCNKYAFDNQEEGVDCAFDLVDVFNSNHPLEEPLQPKMLVENDVAFICTSTTASLTNMDLTNHDDADLTTHPSECMDKAQVKQEICMSFDRLKCIMRKSRSTQDLLQDWDKKYGLPKSHSRTMMQTNRSRIQIEDNRVLPKWNGQPLIAGEIVQKQKKCVKERKMRNAPSARKVGKRKKHQ